MSRALPIRAAVAALLAVSVIAPAPALARPKPHWVQVDGWEDDRVAGFIDMKSLKKKHGRLRADGLLVPYVADGRVDRVRVSLEFDCENKLHKQHQALYLDARGQALPDQPESDPSPITPRTAIKTRAAVHDLACHPKGWKKKLVFRSEESAVAWARVHAPLEPVDETPPPPPPPPEPPKAEPGS